MDSRATDLREAAAIVDQFAQQRRERLCRWPLQGSRRLCSRAADELFGDLPVCRQHFASVLEHMRTAIRDGSEEVRRVAHDALNGRLAHLRPEDPEQQAHQKLRERQLVYFVERDGFCKIGYTTNLTKRVQEIGRGSSLIEGMTVGPVQVLATIAGADRSVEEQHHRRFAHLRIGGEWFRLDDELRAYIGSL